MALKDYFKIELESGRKPNILDYMSLVMVIPYMAMILVFVAILMVPAAFVRLSFWLKKKPIPPTFS